MEVKVDIGKYPTGQRRMTSRGSAPLRQGLAFRLVLYLGDLEQGPTLFGPQFSHQQNGEVKIILSKFPPIYNIPCLDSNGRFSLQGIRSAGTVSACPSEGCMLLTSSPRSAAVIRSNLFDAKSQAFLAGLHLDMCCIPIVGFWVFCVKFRMHFPGNM